MCQVIDDLINNGRQQGIEQGIEQGIKRGIERGIEQGIERGIEQGKTEEQRCMIEKLLKKQVGTERQVADMLDMPYEKVHSIAMSMDY